MDIVIIAVLSFVGSCAPAILFNINRNKIIWAGIAGTVGAVFYNLVLLANPSLFAAAFVGGFTTGVYSEIMARIKKAPALMFYIPGLFPLVPGYTAYTTVLLINQHHYSEAAVKGFEAIGIGGSICFGLMVSSAIMKYVLEFFYKTFISKKNKEDKI